MISIVMPAYNERASIGLSVRLFRKYADEVIVVDNNSTDGTGELAKKAGARVVKETRQGYGAAIRRGLKEARGSIIVIVEPDCSFVAGDLPHLLNALETNRVGMVLGSRTYSTFNHHAANMGLFLRTGNIFLAKVMQVLFRTPRLTDVGCTYRVIRKSALEKIRRYFSVYDSRFSPDMMVAAALSKISFLEVPIHYSKRLGSSKITGSLKTAFVLGLRMLKLMMSRFARGKRTPKYHSARNTKRWPPKKARVMRAKRKKKRNWKG